MSGIPAGLHYTEEHEYVRPTDEENEFLVGITDYAQGELGGVVFLELPGIGEAFDRMEVFGTIEAVKAVSDLYSPLACEIVDVNPALDDDPALVNTDPYGEGWMVRVRVSDTSALEELREHEAYRKLVG